MELRRYFFSNIVKWVLPKVYTKFFEYLWMFYASIKIYRLNTETKPQYRKIYALYIKGKVYTYYTKHYL